MMVMVSACPAMLLEILLCTAHSTRNQGAVRGGNVERNPDWRAEKRWVQYPATLLDTLCSLIMRAVESASWFPKRFIKLGSATT